MTNTINNLTNTQADKPTPSPQPAPDQKTNTPTIPPAVNTTPAPPAQPDKPITKPPAETEIKTTEPAQNADIASKELPHRENDLVPFEILEPEQEPPEKLGLKDAISTLPENEKQEANISKAPEPVITTMPKSTPAQPANKPAKTDFAVQFRNRLKQLLGKANQKRQDKAQNNLDKIMKYAREKQKVTNDDVERLTGVKHIQAARYLKKLKKQGKLVRFGKTINIFYKPVKE